MDRRYTDGDTDISSKMVPDTGEGDRTIPTLGLDNYRTIRENGAYIADKTMFIDRILRSSGSGVFLFTRPRRFGKSINLTMLDGFLNVRHRGNDFFDGTLISRVHEWDDVRNTFPVINLDLRMIHPFSERDVSSHLNRLNIEAYRRHSYLKDSDRLEPWERDMVRTTLGLRPGDIDDTPDLRTLSELLHRHHGRPCVVLIDEYDAPLHNTMGTDMYPETVARLRSTLSMLLKGNENLRLAVIMGIMQVAKASLLSDLNNIRVSSVLDTDAFGDCFGLTEAEVVTICRESDRTEMLDDVRRFYDGYLFSGTHIYNPLSVMSFAESGMLDTYWLNTGSDSLIGELIASGGPDLRSDIVTLLSGGTVRKVIDRRTAFPESGKVSEMDPDTAFGILTQTGYLTAARVGTDEYDLSIPNEEVRHAFTSNVRRALGRGARHLNGFVEAVLGGDAEKVRRSLEDIVSDWDLRAKAPESSYQMFVAGMLSVQSTHDVQPELYSGHGVADVGIVPKGHGTAAVMEFKRTDADLEAEAEFALKQVLDRKYGEWIRGDGVLAYGIAMGARGVAVKMSRIRRDRLLDEDARHAAAGPELGDDLRRDLAVDDHQKDRPLGVAHVVHHGLPDRDAGAVEDLGDVGQDAWHGGVRRGYHDGRAPDLRGQLGHGQGAPELGELDVQAGRGRDLLQGGPDHPAVHPAGAADRRIPQLHRSAERPAALHPEPVLHQEFGDLLLGREPVETALKNVHMCASVTTMIMLSDAPDARRRPIRPEQV